MKRVVGIEETSCGACSRLGVDCPKKWKPGNRVVCYLEKPIEFGIFCEDRVEGKHE